MYTARCQQGIRTNLSGLRTNRRISVRPMTRRCIVCGDTLDRHRGARGPRCGTCATHRYRHGVDRTEAMIIRLTQRDIERALTRRACNC